MSTPRLLRLIVTSLVLFLSAAAAEAWDGMGHLLIDEIAYERVTPGVRERVNALARLLDDRHNARKPYNFVTIGCYMDDMRASPDYPYTTWHFIDAPYTPDGAEFSEPPPPHVLWALQRSVGTLRNAHSTDADKAVALAMLMHFVGDIHQPLHCVDWNDKGGNGYFIAGVPFNDFSKKQVPNLHAFWDRAYRYDAKNGKPVELYYNLWPSERPDVPANGIIPNQAKKIMNRYPYSNLVATVRIEDARSWALESYRLGCRLAYPRRGHPANYEVVTLPPWFVAQSHEVASRRIALAGYRLANLLNELFAAKSLPGATN